MTNDKPELTELERENRRNLRRLVLSMQASFGKLNLLVGICDNSQYRDSIVRSYETELQTKGVACYRVKIDRDRPSLKQVLLDLQNREPQLELDAAKVVTVLGVDTLLSIRQGEPKSPQEKFFFSAQWTREGLRQFQFPVVIWVTEAIARSLAQLAPDFWSWRGGVFEFRQPIGYLLQPADSTSFASSQESYSPEPIANPAELQQQIESLLAEDPDSPLLRSLYSSLGKIYNRRLEQGKATNYPQEQQHAIAAFQKAIDLATEDDPERATDCSYLAGLYSSMGRYSEAEPLYHRTLGIFRQCLGEEHPSTQTVWRNFRYLIQQAVEHGKAAELSDHPVTQAILGQLIVDS